MTETHPLAPHSLPSYLPGPDGSDPLFTVVVIFLIFSILAIGVFYFKLHSLPEHLGAKSNSTQLQLISVLCVLALFTHNNAFWVLALLIAVIRIPDFLAPLQSIAESLGTIAASNKASETTPPAKQQNAGTNDSPSKPVQSEKEEI